MNADGFSRLWICHQRNHRASMAMPTQCVIDCEGANLELSAFNEVTLAERALERRRLLPDAHGRRYSTGNVVISLSL